jgi:hypothetical protein
MPSSEGVFSTPLKQHSLPLPLSESANNHGSYHNSWQPERREKHRARFCPKSHECELFARREENGSSTAKRMNEGTFASRPIKPECETRKVPLDPRVPDKAVMISQDLSSNKEAELLSFLDRNSDVFAWQTSDLTGVSRDIIELKL